MAFDDNGDRMFAEYEVINVRDHQRKKIVGKLLYDAVCICNFANDLLFYQPFLYLILGGNSKNGKPQTKRKKNQYTAAVAIPKQKNMLTDLLKIENLRLESASGIQFIFVNCSFVI